MQLLVCARRRRGETHVLGDIDFAFCGLLAVDGEDENIGRALFDGFDCAV